MINIRITFIFSVLFIVLAGCAGSADYSIPLPNGYRIDRLSTHEVGIYAEDVQYTNDHSIFNYNYVPSKVTDIWWNDDYIIAKQVTLQSDNGGVTEPNESQFSYWFIDMHAHLSFGPFDAQELLEQKKRAGLFEETPLRSIDDLTHLKE